MFGVKTAHAFDLAGDLKIFHLMSASPRGANQVSGVSSGALSSRLKLKQRVGDWSLDVQPVILAMGSSSGSSGAVNLTPNLSNTGEAVPLSLTLVEDGGAVTQGRLDRLALSYNWKNLRWTIGRQALTFGQGRVFTPLDRVSPFSPVSIDREYKPGVDAVRLDGFWGVSGEATCVVAMRGDRYQDDAVFAVKIKDSFDGIDLGLIAQWVGGDQVIGLTGAGGVGSVSIYGDVAYTRRASQGIRSTSDQILEMHGAFWRASLGGDWNWTLGGGGGVNIEAAWLGDGTHDPSLYLSNLEDVRVKHGERWLLGRAYMSVSLRQQLTPLMAASMTGLGNMEDRSMLLGPSIVWSISDEVNASIGGLAGMGSGVENESPKSEFGVLKWLTFAMMSAYY